MPTKNERINVGDIDKLDYSNMGPEELATSMAHVLIKAMGETGVFTAVDLQVAVNQFHILGRVKEENEARLVEEYGFPMLESVLDRATLFLGKSFFLKDGHRRYGWQISVGADDLVAVVRDMCLALERSTEAGILDIDPGTIPMLGNPEPVGDVKSGRRGVSVVKAGP
jgi:hypothetical protein